MCWTGRSRPSARPGCPATRRWPRCGRGCAPCTWPTGRTRCTCAAWPGSSWPNAANRISLVILKFLRDDFQTSLTRILSPDTANRPYLPIPFREFAVRAVRLLLVASLVVSGVGVATLPAGATDPVPTVAPQPTCVDSALPPVSTAVAAPRQTLRLPHDAGALETAPAVVNTSPTVQAASLSPLPPLDQGMTNVTSGPRRGYRFLPSGKFKANLKLSLPYDPALIPAGLSDQDVQTYYYDVQAASWKALQRVSIDG